MHDLNPTLHRRLGPDKLEFIVERHPLPGINLRPINLSDRNRALVVSNGNVVVVRTVGDSARLLLSRILRHGRSAANIARLLLFLRLAVEDFTLSEDLVR